MSNIKQMRADGTYTNLVCNLARFPRRQTKTYINSNCAQIMENVAEGRYRVEDMVPLLSRI